MAAPQIKHDLNRSGWESTDFPSVCENCLPENPYVQMIKEDHGAECKIVSFTQHELDTKLTRLVYASLYHLPLESRPHLAPEAHHHLPYLRPS
jgi:hypothetical protein